MRLNTLYFNILLASLRISLTSLTEQQSPTQLRWCISGKQKFEMCQNMARELAKDNLASISCIRAIDDFECMENIRDNKADVINLNAEKIYIAGKYFGLKPILFERVNNASVFSDDAVVVVKKLHYFAEGLQDLHLKRLCLSGSDEHNIQYQALVNVLFPLGLAPEYNRECKSTIPSLAQYFSESCVPGEWALDETMRKKYGEKMCKLCKSGCTEQDYFAGQDGAIRCLINNQADVAITSTEAVIRAKLDPKAYQILCIQGTRKNLTKSCEWTGRRTNAIVTSITSSGQTSNKWKKILLRISEKYGSKYKKRPDWLNHMILSKPSVQRLEDVYYHNTYERYLGLIFVRSMNGSPPLSKLSCDTRANIKWCLGRKSLATKCKRIAMAWEAERLKPHIACIVARSMEECEEWIQKGIVDVTIMRPDATFKGFISNNLAVVAQEQYTNDADASSYGLAVVKRGTKINFASLLGSKSCHPSANDLIGWYGPLALLEKHGKLRIQQCDYALSAGSFFWESCVPEINVYAKYKKANYENLCALCDGIPNCAWNSTMIGYKGALKCLAKTNAQIAFVDNDTLLSGDRHFVDQYFELMCLNDTRASIFDYAKCYWLKIPPKLIVVSRKTMGEDDRRKLTQNLMKAQTYFGLNQMTDDQFSLFSTETDPSTIFTQQTIALRPVWPEDTTDSIFGQDFSYVYQKYISCASDDARASVRTMMILIVIVDLLLLLFNND